MNNTLMDTKRFFVESHAYRIEMFRSDEMTEFAQGPRYGFFCYVSTRLDGEDWCEQTKPNHERERTWANGEAAARKHWKQHNKKKENSK